MTLIPLPLHWTYQYLNQTTSTMDVSKIWLSHQDSSHFPHIIHAGHQTNGYGQRNRPWISGEGNLYASIILPLNFSLKIVGQLSIATIVAIGKTLDQLGFQKLYQYKWPNDLFIKGGKAGGVLLQIHPNRTGDSVIVGIGLNIFTIPEFEAEYKGSSLKKGNINSHVTALKFLEKFSFIYQEVLTHWQEMGFCDIRKQWIISSMDMNRVVSYQDQGKFYEGIFVGIDENGFAIIKRPDSTIDLFQNRTFR